MFNLLLVVSEIVISEFVVSLFGYEVRESDLEFGVWTFGAFLVNCNGLHCCLLVLSLLTLV